MPAEGRQRIIVRIHDAVSVEIIYDGGPYNPLIVRKGETEDALLGLKLMKQSALRAQYKRSENNNVIKLVV
jgi:hypothetical protein